ncbi:hypothetical protein Ccrd_011146 [Cynara cardunculus var. scolymus]|uniref:Uncharacterized protein n=1 Tax=Cynara cardunculus var. scolymus TaxID=59895 RepID=A0A103YJY8_CYNCS|nr:hypothetical protein Ccrd_011146 [Cynara cardunculus var. scolymus]
MDILDGVGSGCWVGLDDPVSIWTTCLKEVVSAWTKVVGYGFGSDLETGLGVSGGVWMAAPPPAAAACPLLLLLLPLLDGEFAGDGFSVSCCLETISIDGFFCNSDLGYFLLSWRIEGQHFSHQKVKLFHNFLGFSMCMLQIIYNFGLLICRTVSVGSDLCFNTNNAIRTLKVSRHPYSDTHLGIISSDSVFSVYKWESILEIYIDAQTFGLKAASSAAVSNANLAISWLEATFPELAPQAAEGRNQPALKSHRYALFDASVSLQFRRVDFGLSIGMMLAAISSRRHIRTAKRVSYSRASDNNSLDPFELSLNLISQSQHHIVVSHKAILSPIRY